MVVEVKFYLFGEDEENIIRMFFVHNEMHLGKLSDFMSQLYNEYETAIIKEINIKRV